MDRASVESRFSLIAIRNNAPVTGTFQWAGTQMKFVPTTPLDYETQYRATLKAGAQDINGKAATLKDVTWSFRTSRQPGIITTIPGNGDTDSKSIRNGLQIY